MNHLDKDKFYMNPFTGSVDTGQNWEKDFDSRDEEDMNKSWVEWGGEDLVEVEMNENGSWEEVE